jgi:hypothetical protein
VRKGKNDGGFKFRPSTREAGRQDLQDVMYFVVKNSLISIIVISLSGWLFVHGCREYRIKTVDDPAGLLKENDLPRFPQVPFKLGRRDYYNNSNETAAEYLKIAISGDIFFISAWLRLAQIEAATGNGKKAREILEFTSRYTRRVIRWKWRQALLARELGMNDLFFFNTNVLLTRPGKRPDTFQLIDTHFQGHTLSVLNVLAPEHRTTYLNWLIGWNRVNDTQTVWKEITKTDPPDPVLAARYVHFLVGQNKIEPAAAIWQELTGIDGVTNSGFEKKATHTGFDWRYSAARPGKWRIQRVGSPVHSGDFALEITFEGRENLSFSHLWQIVPITSHLPFKLTYAWQSHDVTTDQGPFVEVYGYNCKGLYKRGQMMLGTNSWQKGTIDFTLPEACRAVVIRLRRLPSKRFDSLISGKVRLDDFRLEVK